MSIACWKTRSTHTHTHTYTHTRHTHHTTHTPTHTHTHHTTHTHTSTHTPHTPHTTPHTHTHTHTHTHHTNTDTTQRQIFLRLRRPCLPAMHFISKSVSYVLVVTLMCKFISFSYHSAVFNTKFVWFLLTSNHISKTQLKQKIYSDEFPSMLSENFLKPTTGCEIIIMLILTKMKIKNLIQILK